MFIVRACWWILIKWISRLVCIALAIIESTAVEAVCPGLGLCSYDR